MKRKILFFSYILCTIILLSYVVVAAIKNDFDILMNNWYIISPLFLVWWILLHFSMKLRVK